MEAKTKVKPTMGSFKLLNQIGSGRYCKVHKVLRYADRKHFALKIIDKKKVTQSKMFKYVLQEKKILNQLNHPNCLQVENTFSDRVNVYLLTEFCPNGELWDLLQRKKKGLRVQLAQFIFAEVVVALEHLHSQRILHRDVKPENIFFDANRHVRLGDFGTSKELTPEQDINALFPVENPELYMANDEGDESSDYVDSETDSDEDDQVNETAKCAAEGRPAPVVEKKRKKKKTVAEDEEWDDTMTPEQEEIARTRKRLSFVGTPEFMSPEVLHNKNMSLACDLWSLGVLLYQMISGTWPFHGESPYLTFKQTLKRKKKLKFRTGFNSNARDLIEKLLDLDPWKRPGARSFADLKEHKFFTGLDWNTPLIEQPVPKEEDFSFFMLDENQSIVVNIMSYLPLQEYENIAQVSPDWESMMPRLYLARGIF